MDERLMSIVARRIDADQSLSDDVGLVVLAACEGDTELNEAISAGPGKSMPPATVLPETDTVEPAGAYLGSITVEGFRGVGEERTLELTPGPGLTLVVGRNGSGKSSFVEALEVLLTSESKRWSTRKEKVWSQGWRNLHHPDPARVVADFVLDGVGPRTTVTKQWSADQTVGDAAAVVQTHGQAKTTLHSLGWDVALAAYRPILSYNELGSILDEGPTKLYDAVVGILGLDDLTAAGTRLTSLRGDLKKLVDRAKAEAKMLIVELDDSTDERAQAASKALGARKWSLDRIGGLATGTATSVVATDIELLRAFATLPGPDSELVQQAVAFAREAADRADAVSGTEAESAARTAALLEAALDHHQHVGDETCPVCGAGSLDETWAVATRTEVKRLQREAREARNAKAQLEEARLRLKSLLVLPSVSLPEATRLDLPASDMRAAWEDWLDISTDDVRAAAAASEAQLVVLAGALDAFRPAAAAALAAREDNWSPLAEKLAAWLELARRAEVADASRSTVDKAEQWVKATIDQLRNERLAPLAQQAADIWKDLSQHSNIELGPMTLSGTGTKRKVDLDVRVDGVGSVALAVMSQGELHALALAIFLPRVTAGESPFRFLIIDDPVQAMDPAKVEGLARVMERTAEARQVVVFTHDDRLPEAVRRLGIDATIIEVSRRPGSQVDFRPGGDPATVYLDDALAVSLSGELPEEVRKRVVPGYCRLALEAVLNEVIRRKGLANGTSHHDIEAQVQSVTTLTTRAALALFGDSSKGAEVLPRLGAYGKNARDAYQASNKGVHEGYPGDLKALVQDTRHLVEKLRTAP